MSSKGDVPGLNRASVEYPHIKIARSCEENQIGQIAQALSEMLGRRVDGRRVDLCTHAKLSYSFRDQLLADAVTEYVAE